MLLRSRDISRGFTLIELMIVISIITIISAIAIPNLLESKKAANEVGAIGALRTVGTAEELYNTRFGSYGTLTQLSGKKFIDNVLGAQDADSPKGGYNFTITPSGVTGWCCTATPTSWGTTGARSFRCTQNGVIYYSTSAGVLNTGGVPLGKTGG